MCILLVSLRFSVQKNMQEVDEARERYNGPLEVLSLARQLFHEQVRSNRWEELSTDADTFMIVKLHQAICVPIKRHYEYTDA